MSRELALVAVVIVSHEGRVLVGIRPDDAAEEAGRHEFPGGKLEPGETVAMAAARECLEEAGVAVRIGSVVDEAESTSDAGLRRIVFVAATPVDATVEPRPPFRWLPCADLARCDFPGSNARVVARLVSGQGGS